MSYREMRIVFLGEQVDVGVHFDAVRGGGIAVNSVEYDCDDITDRLTENEIDDIRTRISRRIYDE